MLFRSLSGAAAYLPLLRGVSTGVKTIGLTVVIALAAAILFPVGEEGQRHGA